MAAAPCATRATALAFFRSLLEQSAWMITRSKARDKASFLFWYSCSVLLGEKIIFLSRSRGSYFVFSSLGIEFRDRVRGSHLEFSGEIIELRCRIERSHFISTRKRVQPRSDLLRGVWQYLQHQRRCDAKRWRHYLRPRFACRRVSGAPPRSTAPYLMILLAHVRPFGDRSSQHTRTYQYRNVFSTPLSDCGASPVKAAAAPSAAAPSAAAGPAAARSPAPPPSASRGWQRTRSTARARWSATTGRPAAPE